MKAVTLDEEYDLFEEADEASDDPLHPLLADGTVREVLGALKSGKEGTVYICRVAPETGHQLAAAKVYRSRNERTFRNDAVYSEGRSFGKARENRAVKKKTRVGRQLQQGAWPNHEWETLRTLSAAGADVPVPIARAPSAILMSFIGNGDSPAPGLGGVRLDAAQVRPAFDRIMANIELLLDCHIVHGDLSPYNILYGNEAITLIDFPQAVDPRSNRNALDLLVRDLTNVCGYFIRHGMQVNAERIAHHLWGRYLRSEL